VKVVIAGASGFMGRDLVRRFTADGDEVATIGRSGADAGWGDAEALVGVLDGADLLVNLAGRSVNCRYHARNRREILRSRVDTTLALAAAIRRCARPPALWVNSSTATIYRHAVDRPMTERAGEIGEGFSVGIATAWEAAFFEGELPGVRRVAIRTAIVLGHGSVLGPYSALVRAGLGGPQLDGRWPATAERLRAGTYHRRGSSGGRQRFSWVHLDDVHGVLRFLAASPDASGVYNVSSPEPTDNRTFMRTLRRVLGVPFGLPAPRAVLEIGTALIRTETELVLKSRWVVPERLLAEGYRFVRPGLEDALREATSRE